MSTPTPSPIPNTAINNFLSFIGQSTGQVELLIVGGIVVTLFLVILYLREKRR
jgi:hypothetical protein